MGHGTRGVLWWKENEEARWVPTRDRTGSLLLQQARNRWGRANTHPPPVHSPTACNKPTQLPGSYTHTPALSVPSLCLPSSQSMGRFSSQHTAGDQLAKGTSQTKRALHVHPLLDQCLKQVLPGRLLLSDTSARRQPAQLLKGSWNILPQSTQGITPKWEWWGFSACFCIWEARDLSYIQGNTVVKKRKKCPCSRGLNRRP